MQDIRMGRLGRWMKGERFSSGNIYKGTMYDKFTPDHEASGHPVTTKTHTL